MEVILLQDVKGIGKKGDTKIVNDGYAANFLIPRKLAVRKTIESLHVLEKEQANEAAKQAELKAIALKNKERIESMTIEFTNKAQKDGSMAGNISLKAIAERLKKQYQIEIDKRKFIDKFNVNAFGITNLRIELYKDVIATIRIHVKEEK